MTKEDVKRLCTIYDNMRNEQRRGTIAYNSEDTFYGCVLATFRTIEPSLSSNLDEVGKTTIKKEFDDYIEKKRAWEKDNYEIEYDNGDSFNHTYDLYPLAQHFFDLGKKAGAEWMAQQGVTIEGVCSDGEFIDTDHGILSFDEDKRPFDDGDKVIVQIRKK